MQLTRKGFASSMRAIFQKTHHHFNKFVSTFLKSTDGMKCFCAFAFWTEKVYTISVMKRKDYADRIKERLDKSDDGPKPPFSEILDTIARLEEEIHAHAHA